MGEIATVTAAMLANAFKAAYEGEGGFCLRLYSSPRRASTADAVGAATLLCTVTSDASPLSFETAVDELLAKATAEVWEGTNVASGTCIWGCFSPLSDTGEASTTIHRTDFSVGLWTDAPLPDYKMSNNVLVETEVTRMNQANFTFVRDVSQL